MAKKSKKTVNTLEDLAKIIQPSALSAQNPGPSALPPRGALSAEPTAADNDEVVDVDADEDSDVVENDDGSATITMSEEDAALDIGKVPFGVNLATVLPEHVLDTLSLKYMQLIENAIEARKKRDEQYEEGLKRAGLGDPAPGGAEFDGASRVTHPVLAEAYVDFSASAMKELFQPNGPVRVQIEGTPNEMKMDKAERKCAFMNHQLTKEIPEYRSELEILLTQLPAGGSQFLKIYHSGALGRIVVDFVGVDEFILPFNCKGFKRAPFKFHRLKKNEFEVNQDVSSGLYRDVSLTVATGFEDDTKTEMQTQKIEGKDFNWGANENGEYIFYEGTVFEDEFDDPKRPKGRECPYIVTLDEGSNKVLSIYRNWDEQDKKCEDIPYMVEFKFIPWRGAYGIGLPHLIGDLAAALTGTLRALLDSAHIQNSATALKLKGRPGGETVSASPTQVSEIDSLAGDDIRKVIMPLSFNGPSPVLLQLLGFLQTAAKGVVSTSEEKIAEAGNQMPVGTALALIEQGAKVFSSIHARLHEAQREALTIIHRLNFKHIQTKVTFGEDPRDYVTQQDFAGPLDIHPVSDPNIFSETQRFAQMQAVLAMAEKAPNVMSLAKCYERMLKLMRVPDFKELMLAPPPPKVQHPAAENVMMMMGKPTMAFPDQDHMAHLQVHLDFLKDQYFGMNQMYARAIIPQMLEHVKQHVAFWYGNLMRLEGRNHLGQEIADIQVQDKSWPTDRKVSEALARGSETVLKAMDMVLQKAKPVLDAAMNLLQQLSQQPQQQDPNFIIAMHELEQRKAEHGDEMKIEEQRLLQAMRKMMGDQAYKVHKLEQDMRRFVTSQQTAHDKTKTEALTDVSQEAMRSATKMHETEADNQVALEIAEMRGDQQLDVAQLRAKPKSPNGTTH